MHLLTIVGARPQFIKAAAVSRAVSRLSEAGGRVRETIVHTGQHYDPGMSEVFFTQMRIPEPDINLGIHGLSHGAMTGRMMEAIEAVLREKGPDAVLVYGDTDTTLAGALAAAKAGVPVAHVEAGLRSFNRAMPEEINRVVADRVSDILFCPTEISVANLRAEGIGEGLSGAAEVLLVGDVMYDCARFYAGLAKEREPGPDIRSLLERVGDEGFVLATVHRAGNTDDPERLSRVMQGLARVSEKLPLVLPLHPRTRKRAEQAGLDIAGLAPGLWVTEPVSYLDMLVLLDRCKLVMTDSGGLQKEAYFFKRPCVTLRNETEWKELALCGANRVAGTEPEAVERAFDEMRAASIDFSLELYGRGDAAERIVDRLALL